MEGMLPIETRENSARAHAPMAQESGVGETDSEEGEGVIAAAAITTEIIAGGEGEREMVVGSGRSQDGGYLSSSSTSSSSEVYYMGIIDILQQYNAKKFAENLVMPFVRGEDPSSLSAIAPDAYARRLYDFIKDNTI